MTDQDGKNSVTDASRGVFAGNDQQGSDMEYITINTESNATDFGDLTETTALSAACNSTTRGLRGGGYNGGTPFNTIDYVTIASVGNATDFGDLAVGNQFPVGLSNVKITESQPTGVMLVIKPIGSVISPLVDTEIFGGQNTLGGSASTIITLIIVNFRTKFS